jgi:hypothetical protein
MRMRLGRRANERHVVGCCEELGGGYRAVRFNGLETV